MDSESEMEIEEQESEDGVVEDSEFEINNKRINSVGNYLQKEGKDGEFKSGGSKRLKIGSEKEMNKLCKPATAEELKRLRETENLFHSNLFRLQIEEMLKEVKLKGKYKKEFGSWFEKFHSSVMKIPDGQKKHDLSDKKWLKQIKVKIPIPQFSQVPKGTYVMRKPVNVKVVGSFYMETMVGPKVAVDIVIGLPNKFYKKEDFINGVYHLKRAFYLCHLINYIQNQNELVEGVNFLSDGNDILKPKIEIKPPGKLGKNVSIILDVVPEIKGLNLSQFNPSKNNVCKSWFFNESEKFFGDLDINFATPFYNSTILADLTLMENYKFLTNILQPHKNLKDGVILLKVWMRQRELSSGIGDFSGFLMTMLVAYLLQIKKINAYMSSYQVVRSVLIYLVSSDWISNGITLCKNKENNAPTMSEFHEQHKVVFVDTTGYYNLCYAVHPSTFQRIQSEAQIALTALDDPNVNSFQILFMTPVPFYSHYDHLIIFHNKEALLNIGEIHGSIESKLNHCGTLHPQVASMVYDVLKRGFNKRVNCLHMKQPEKSRWKPEKKFRHNVKLSFGLNLDLENYFSAVEKAGERESLEFKEFWGSISELRRFQDGSITEAVVWDAELFSEKRLICKKITNYLMKSKFGMDSKDFEYIADQLDDLIGRGSEECARKVTEVFGRLNKELRGLKNLPLDVVSVQGTSPVFRYTEVSPLSRHRFYGERNCSLTNEKSDGRKKNNHFEMMDINMAYSPPYICPVEIVIQMGASNRWPQDLRAVHRLRTAFYVKIAEALNNQCLIKAVSFVDKIQLQKQGYVFHIKIFCPNEIGLVKKIFEDGIIKYRDNEISLALEKEMVLLPKISSALHGLYEQQSSFGPACCMVKRWINSQMIDSSHISEEVLEMLMASLYLKPIPHEVPKQPQVAFFRFLYMMGSTNWNAEYIVLNINNEFSREDMLEIESNFRENRDTLPALFIVTPFDRKSVWTKDCPSPLILLRLVELCRNALYFIEQRIYKNLCLRDELKILFEPCLKPYNVIIHLNKNHIPRMEDNSELHNKENKEKAEVGPVPVNGYDPVWIYVNELRESYNEAALFFFDKYGGSIIGVLWKPDAFDGKDFKTSNMAMRTYDDSTKKLYLKKELVIEDFLIIGKGLVKSVDVNENGIVKSYCFL